MEIVAHRGVSAKAPENTLAAFRLAKEVGVEWVEFDVQTTKDMRLVVMHDETVDRTTDGRGVLGEMTLEEARKLDAGSWFNAGFSGEKLPIFSEVLDLIGQSMKMNIEIKSYGREPFSGTEEKILEELSRRSLMSNVVISSNDIKILEKIKKISPKVKIGLHNFEDKNTGQPTKLEDYLKMIDKLDVFWFPYGSHWPYEAVRAAKKRGLWINGWVGDDKNLFNKYYEWNLDEISSNNPAVLKTYLEERGQRRMALS